MGCGSSKEQEVANPKKKGSLIEGIRTISL
jgi:hypothetical protein